jgi:hypothetical protein
MLCVFRCDVFICVSVDRGVDFLRPISADRVDVGGVALSALSDFVAQLLGHGVNLAGFLAALGKGLGEDDRERISFIELR